jgi:probable HAF family extracellular repeat protein
MKAHLIQAIHATTLLGALLATHASAQVTFQPFGTPDAFIQDMSADGTVVVGMWVAQNMSTQAFRWTSSTGVVNIGGDMNAVNISRDGKTIVGAARDASGIRSAAIWQGGTNWKLLGGVPGGVPGSNDQLSSANGVSADGSIIVGSAGVANSKTHAFRWDAVNGMVDLGNLQSSGGSYARSISADGTTILGYDSPPSGVTSKVPGGQRGVVFHAGLESFIHAFGWAGEARYCNADCSVIVGAWNPQLGTYFPNGYFYSSKTTYRYTAADGRFQNLGAAYTVLPGDPLTEYTSYPWGVSDDGNVVVGATGYDPQAALWTPNIGDIVQGGIGRASMVRVADYLTAFGVTAHVGWKLTSASYVSPDGTIIAGTGINRQLRAESWIVTLPNPGLGPGPGPGPGAAQ